MMEDGSMHKQDAESKYLHRDQATFSVRPIPMSQA